MQVERVMKLSLREVTSKAVANYTEQSRTEWVLNWPGQVVLAASTIHWTAEVSTYSLEYNGFTKVVRIYSYQNE